MKILCENKTQVVLYFESQKSPDAMVLKLLKRLSHTDSLPFKQIIIVCHFDFTHKRLTNTENLEVLFSVKKQNKTVSPRKKYSKNLKTVFEIDRICIQKNQNPNLLNDSHHKNFSFFENQFSENSENKIVFSLNELFELVPIFIPKPWGQEIWYSGIETRGVANIRALDSASAETVPLSWIVSSVPSLLFGKKFAHKDPVLIKILDPLAEEVIGDLYYELHLEKNEVYVVTDIASEQGKIKIGINPHKLALYKGNQKKYKNDFLKNILDYEKVRREIDTLRDSQKSISTTLSEQEIALRKNMDSFCGYLNLNIGDVINVPTHIPHALQHGVKVIEFQTPTYERLIISFAQKVLTQSHWDTKHAFDVMAIKPFQKQTLKILSKTKHLLKELVCEFPDFKASRWTIDSKSKHQIARKSHYSILFVVSGEISLTPPKKKKAHIISNGMCIFIPQNTSMTLLAKTHSVFLECIPRPNDILN